MIKSFNKMMYILAALIGFLVMAGFVFYFLTNTLVNLIGVPLAAYNSYEAWQMSGESVGVPASEFIVQEKERHLPFIIYQKLLSVFIILRLIFVFFFYRELRRFKFRGNKFKGIWLVIVMIFGTLGYILYLVYRKITRIPRGFNPQFRPAT